MNTCNSQPETVLSPDREEIVHRPQFRTKEDENGATLHVALPGVRKEDLKLTLHESNLRIEAKRSNSATHRTGRFRLDIRLTARLDGTQTTAALDAGVLTLQVPVREEAKPREIAVN